MRPLIAFIAVLAMAGCASTNEPGWSGRNATPFGASEAECASRAEAEPPGRAREAVFDACMAEHGWLRSNARSR